MKGYLQRMVAGVARPERTVHPLVGGMFSKDRQQEIVEESAIVSAPKEIRRTDADSVERHDLREMAMPERAEVPRLQPLVERNAERNVRRDEAQQSWMSAEEAKAKSAARAEDYRGDQSAAAERHTSLSVQVRNLLVREDVGREAEEQVKREFIDANATAENAGQFRARQLPEGFVAERVSRQEIQRGSEDIQVHIGRIEVIAVPPPVQRAVPVATRKSESLEEYLRRRDRRAR